MALSIPRAASPRGRENAIDTTYGGVSDLKRIRWGVIGAGGIAERRTIPGMMLCDKAELVAVMEINMELAERCRAKWGCKRAYDSEAALLADPEIDAVYIASPVVMHAKQAMLAADAGKHILIEKPLAMSSEEGQRVLDYCAEKGVRIAAGLMMRFGSYVQVMKQAIAEGKIGRPVSGYSQFTCWYPDMPGVWRQSKKSGGGGAMMDMGVHIIDLMQYVLGTRAVQVASLQDTLSFHYEVEDSSTVLLRMENGAQCVVQTNFNIPDQAASWRLEFFGDQGRLMGQNVVGQVDGGALDALFLGPQGGYDAIQDVKEAEGEHIDVEFGNLYAREIDSFCNSLLTGAPLEVPGTDAVQVQRVMEAAYLSNETGRIITL